MTRISFGEAIQPANLQYTALQSGASATTNAALNSVSNTMVEIPQSNNILVTVNNNSKMQEERERAGTLALGTIGALGALGLDRLASKADPQTGSSFANMTKKVFLAVERGLRSTSTNIKLLTVAAIGFVAMVGIDTLAKGIHQEIIAPVIDTSIDVLTKTREKISSLLNSYKG
jgi:hypothetical protein